MNKNIIKTLGFVFVAALLTGCGNDNPTTLEITKQPQNVTINYGDGISMSVEVNNPELVKSYQWYNGLFENGELTDSIPLVGSKAKTDTYDLNTFLYYYPDANYGFQCKITDIDGNEIESEWAQVFVNPDIDDFPYIVVGDYLLKPGETFDLANTSYGTGTITVNEDCTHFIFDNVMMSNQFFDSNFGGIGFRYLDYGPDYKDVAFEFNGINVFQNHYWDDDYVDGGAIFQYQVLGLPLQELGPTATFTGSGSLSFYGGSYGIYLEHASMIQDIDISFYGQPSRRTNGVKCDYYTLEKDRLFRGSLTGRAVDVFEATLKEGSKFYANLGTAYSGMMGNTSGINATLNVYIYNADVKINTLYDFKKEIEDDVRVISEGIMSNYGEVIINNSNIQISALQYNDDFDFDESVSSATAVGGISANFVELNDSYLKVEINGSAIAEARAINTQGFSATNSKLDLDVAGRTAGGIDSYCVLDTESAPVSFDNTDININLHNYLLDTSDDVEMLPWDNSAIYGTSFDFKSSNQNTITITTNGVPTICLRTRIEDDVDKRIVPHDDYNERHLEFDNVSYSSTKSITYNEKSYVTGRGYNFVYETLYEKLGSNDYQYIDNLIITYVAK